MTAAPAFLDALQRVIGPNPQLGVGLHLSLTCGISLCKADEIPLLVDENQVFRLGFGGILRLLHGRSRLSAREQIERELDAQFAALEAAGVACDHVDSHQYVHMIPEIWSCVLRLAQKYRCPVIRLADEKLRPQARSFAELLRACERFNLAKKLLLSHWARSNRRLAKETYGQSRPVRCTDHFVGVLDSGRMDAATLCRILSSLRPGVTEIVTHPGLGEMTVDQQPPSPTAVPKVVNHADQRFLQSDHRRDELAALLDDRLRLVIDESGAQLVSFRECLIEPCEATL